MITRYSSHALANDLHPELLTLRLILSTENFFLGSSSISGVQDNSRVALKGEQMSFAREMSNGAWRHCRSSIRSSFFVVLVTAVALIFSVSTSAQRLTGTLRGQVLDPSGAVVPNAEVTVTNQDTGVSVRVTTTSAGTYSFPSLIPGLYKINVEAKGFKSFVKKDASVIANQDNVADAQMDLGVASEVIEVTGGAVEVQTTSSSLNNTYDWNAVQLPSAAGALNASPLNLAVLAPNVVAQPGGVTGIGGSVGGTRPRDNNFTVDGVDDNNLGVTGNNSTVIPDAVSEFNLTTNQFSAEYGHSAGGQFSLVTKTGTNAWHGTGEWYTQNRTSIRSIISPSKQSRRERFRDSLLTTTTATGARLAVR